MRSSKRAGICIRCLSKIILESNVFLLVSCVVIKFYFPTDLGL